ncbi:MAG: hypothetical protein LBB20_02780 [Puniceicoccales bacterium]|jgi:general secretion pathway protein D|nr:hypothetical protein [Puniceicoccales bacterium]
MKMNRGKVLFLTILCFFAYTSSHCADLDEDMDQLDQQHEDNNPMAAGEIGGDDAENSNDSDGSNGGNNTEAEVDDNTEVDDDSDPSNDIVEQLVLAEEGVNQVLSILEKLTGKTVLREKIPETKISLEIQQPMTRAEAILAIESLLALNGIAIIDMGDDFIKAVTAKNTSSNAPELVDDTLVDVVASQKAYSKFFTFSYLDAGDFNKLIKPLVTGSLSQVIHFQSSNSLLVIDSLANLQRIEEIVKRVDVPIDIKEEMYFHVLNNVKVSSVMKCIKDICNHGSFKKYFSNNTTIESDETTNQLIIMAPSESLSVIKRIITNLDVNKEPLTRTEVIRIKHGDAKDISEVMRKIIDEQRKQEDKANSYRLANLELQAQRNQNSAPVPPRFSIGMPNSADTSSANSISNQLGEQDMQFSNSLAIEHDDRSNSIIVHGTPSDISRVKSIISKLDVLLDQVRIEVVIAQVTLDKGQVSGLDAFNVGFKPSGGSSGGSSGGEGGAEGASSSSDSSGGKGSEISYTIGGADSHFKLTGNLRNFSLDTVFGKAKTDSNIKIMSAPTIVTTHNREALIEVGESMPILESSVSDANTGGGVKTNITYKNVGIMLKVKPLIGNNGIIQLEIEQKIEKKIGEAVFSAGTQPIISTKHATSFVSVADMDVVVMAGLQEKIMENSGGKMWLLGDLPVVGDALFSSRRRKETTTELIIFIKPTIILQPQDEVGYLEKRLTAADLTQDMNSYIRNGKFKDGEPFPEDTLFGLQLAESRRKKREREKILQEHQQLELEEKSKDTTVNNVTNVPQDGNKNNKSQNNTGGNVGDKNNIKRFRRRR